MKRHLDDELKKLIDKLFRMGLLVEKSIEQAMGALFERNVEKAKGVIKSDQEINLYEIEIDEMGHEIMVRFQPAAGDMRLITMVLKINNDLERMGDQAVNISQQAMALSQLPLKPHANLARMAERVTQVVRDSLNAFMEKDVEKAQAILEADDHVDRMNDEIYEQVQASLEKKPEEVRAGVASIMISHNLERIADLATNIAEDVIYLKRGIDVRHHIRERREQEV